MSTRPTGRPTLLTDVVADQICEHLENGNYFAVACRAVGISPDTGLTWRNRGVPGTREYDELGPWDREQRAAIAEGAEILEEAGRFSQFSQRVARAEAAAEVKAVEAVHTAMTTDWRAAVEFLKRKHPDRWREETRIDASVSSTTEHQVSITPQAEQLLEALEAMEKHGLLAPAAAELEPGQDGDDA